jgi:hypothetical protein
MSLLLATALTSACDDSVTTLQPEKLAPPLGLQSVTGSGAVTLSWQASNYGEDRQGFQVYQASGTQPATPTESVPSAFGTTPVATLETSQEAGTFTQTVTGLTDGTTYSFLVVAYKNDGNEVSRTSNAVTDTPRRESAGAVDLTNGAGNARFLDVTAEPLAASTNATGADVLCQSFNAGAGDRPGIVGQNSARVQDLGYVANWDAIDAAPSGAGSYPDATHSVEALENHVYAVFTGDGHYAKLWVTSLHAGDLGFACRVAYQPQAGNNELKPIAKEPQ